MPYVEAGASATGSVWYVAVHTQNRFDVDGTTRYLRATTPYSRGHERSEDRRVAERCVFYTCLSLPAEPSMRCSSLHLVLMSALALGCADDRSPTAPAEQPAPSFRAEHISFPAFIVLGGDPANPLAVAAGFEPDDTPADVCAGSSFVPQGQFRGVLTPPGGFHAHIVGRDVNLVVYAFGAGPVADLCQLIGAPVLATGTGKFTFKFLDTGPGAVVAHATVQGIVDLTSGGRARLFATARVTIRPNGTQLFDVERVRLVPL